MCGDGHARRLTAAVNQINSGRAGLRQCHLPVQRQGTAGGIDGQDTSAGHGPGIVVITDFNDVTGCVPQPLRPEREIHRLRFQQFGLYHPQPGTVGLTAAGTAERVHLQQVASVAQYGFRVFHQFRGGLPAVLRVGVIHLHCRVPVLQGTEAVAETHAVIIHHHIAVGVRPHHIRRTVLNERQRLAVPYRHTAHRRAEITENVPRLTLLCQVRIKGHPRLGPPETIRDRLVAVLPDGIQRPLVHIRRPQTFSHAVARVSQHVPQTPGRVVAVCRFQAAVPDTTVRAFFRVIV